MNALHYLNQLYLHDKNSYVHSLRVGYLACFLRIYYKLSLDFVHAAFFHDIGKIFIPSSILNKKERLSDSEYSVIKLHPMLGYNLLANTGHSLYTRKLVLNHHEHYSGRGYPRGQEDTQLESNLLTLIDSYDALNASRAYKNAISQEDTLTILAKSKDIQFSARAFDMFVSFLDKIDKTILDDSNFTPDMTDGNLQTEGKIFY